MVGRTQGVGGRTHFAISKAAPKEKPYKLSDGFGLHLLVEPHGSKKWRFRYQFGKREKMIALGTYPATSLADARAKRDQARALLEQGIWIAANCRTLSRHLPTPCS